MAAATAIKILLLTHNVRQSEVAAKAKVDRSIVCKVVSGQLTSGRHATRAARAIAKRVGQPVAALFPWAA